MPSSSGTKQPVHGGASGKGVIGSTNDIPAGVHGGTVSLGISLHPPQAPPNDIQGSVKGVNAPSDGSESDYSATETDRSSPSHPSTSTSSVKAQPVTLGTTTKVVTDMAPAPGARVKDAIPKVEKASKLEYKRVNEVHVPLTPRADWG